MVMMEDPADSPTCAFGNFACTLRGANADVLPGNDGTLADIAGDVIPKLAKLPLESQPGTEFRYGLQQGVHGAILRRISGEQLDTFLVRRIFTPQGMKDTGFDVAPDQRDRWHRAMPWTRTSSSSSRRPVVLISRLGDDPVAVYTELHCMTVQPTKLGFCPDV
jgi:CubicO group peptidase (beta-lactamase class C family)